MRCYRTKTTYDKLDRPIVTDISDYKNAQALREISEEYIQNQVAKDLATFEEIVKFRDYLAYLKGLKAITKQGKKKPKQKKDDLNLMFNQAQNKLDNLETKNQSLFYLVDPVRFQHEILQC